ncbi:MAG: ribosomal protein S18-alanine N-acetyltransferase [Nocardioidaceae bacterium]
MSAPDIRVRPAGPADLDALLALEREAFGDGAWSASAVRGELDGVPETRFVIVAEPVDTSELLGYAVLMVLGDTADIQRVAVRPVGRGRGVGRRLLRALLAEAARRGCDRVLLEVATDNGAALALYEAAGFAEIARRGGYYGPGVDALVLALTWPTG